jgi:hypothetical protein
MPGVGVVPFCKLPFATEIPGVEFAVIGSGLFENSGGKFAELREFDKPLTFEFVVSADWQAKFAANIQKVRINKRFFNINFKPRKW